jgi:hypothetical protein
MESLHQLLGDRGLISFAQISRYGDKEKLTLSYILATSLLYLYPGDWVKMVWRSDKVYFPKRTHSTKSSILTLPYLSVDLQQSSNRSKNTQIWYCHGHPAIQALGIMLLEIATDTRFAALCGETIVEKDPINRSNLEGLQALKVLEDLETLGERDASKRIPSALFQAIRSCLQLHPPADSADQSLSEEESIRSYMLSCIISPLATELSTGYEVSLENLHDDLALKEYLENSDDIDKKLVRSGQFPSPIEVVARRNETGMVVSSGYGERLNFAVLAHRAELDTRESCLCGDEEVPVDPQKYVVGLFQPDA